MRPEGTIADRLEGRNARATEAPDRETCGLPGRRSRG
jgi:hypothetical protein